MAQSHWRTHRASMDFERPTRDIPWALRRIRLPASLDHAEPEEKDVYSEVLAILVTARVEVVGEARRASRVGWLIDELRELHLASQDTAARR